MDAKELRIGNWVRYKDSKEKSKILQIRRDGSHQLSAYNLCTTYYSGLIGEYEPIPLTEEILLKCGFRVIGQKSLFWTNDKMYFRLANDFIYRVEIKGGVIDLPYKIKHLHELQNLYFSLTGEELNVEL